MSDKEIMKESELYLNCGSCGDKINLGDSFRYETTGYTPYCQNFDCCGGFATEQGHLEDCWWGEEGEDLIIKWGE
tara:strand:- start:700 stop:924 length:225 start_codon:yes stop_codon:yes gene_type:complete